MTLSMNSLSMHTPLSHEAQAQLFTEARTPKTFSDAPVTPEELRALYDLVKFAPTSMNTNPMRIVFVGHEERDRLVKYVADGNRDKTEAAPVVAILAADLDFHTQLPQLMPHAPGLADKFSDPTGRESAARFNAGLQVGYFILGVRALGLSAGPMGGFDNDGVDAEFLDGTSWRSLALVNIGHPGANAWGDRMPRLDYDDAVKHV